MKKSRKKVGQATNWARVRRLSPGQIRQNIAGDPDAPGTDESFWKDAEVVMPEPKVMVTMRLDRDLITWFRRKRGYQTQINAILRAYMSAKQRSAR
jgi:uncharacterized protein (DUF4415 family)